MVAFAAYFVLPNFPRTTSWLSEEQRQLAVWRLEEDIGEDDWIGSEQQTFFHGLKLAFLDIKMWILVCVLTDPGPAPLFVHTYAADTADAGQMVMLFCIVASGSVTNFFPTVVATLGYGKIDSLLLTAPPYVSRRSSYRAFN